MAIERKLMTAEELWELPDDDMCHELVAGELKTMSPAGDEHGWVTIRFSSSLYNHVEPHGLGRVYTAETGYTLARHPDTVLAPDVSFVQQERVVAGGRIRGFREGAPDLAVEVLSPSDRPGKVADKVARWLAHGTPLVIVVNPDRRRVRLHRPGQPVVELTEADTIEAEDIVQGWRLPVARLFN